MLPLGGISVSQTHLVPQCFPLLVIGYPFNYRDFLFFDKICSKSSAAELSYEEKGSTKKVQTKSDTPTNSNFKVI